MRVYDVIVVGAGHAGCEAAAAAARMGRRVALVTFRREHIARLSCNPAIGGSAKGGLVRELDALGGLMARVADATTIQFRTLNTRKGLAVRSSRAQVDVHAYPRVMREALERQPGLEIVAAEVAGVNTAGGRVRGVTLGDGTRLEAPAVILTTGTFLGGLMHQGERRTPGGRIGDDAALQLASNLRDLGLNLGRLKTGTPPRLSQKSINWSAIERQEDCDGRFSYVAVPRLLPPVSCSITYTNERTHQIIRDNVHRSAMYSGAIRGTGPRYCPSVEDKVVRFEHRERHPIFLEPEGHETDRVYVNGLSTSLPAEVQDEMVHSVVGLESAEILQYGYAVEYDYADPRDLDRGLRHRGLPGLSLAGQVNGTSGYEEAAVQGLIAGVSAALGEVFCPGRDAAYIGVLIDDLVSRGIGGEPYRMFSSRAEHRLHLREDNADRRLTPLGRQLGLIPDAEWEAFQARQEAIQQASEALEALRIVPEPRVLQRLAEAGLDTIRKPTSAAELLRRPEVDYAQLRALFSLPALDSLLAEQVETDIKYAGYIRREEARAERARHMAGFSLEGMDFAAVPGLSTEVRERLARQRPETLGAAARLPGITPAAMSALALYLEGR